jgi:hypothetical protein
MAQETLVIGANPPEIKLPPTQDELPSDDGIPMETQRHGLQMQLQGNRTSFCIKCNRQR